MRVIDRQRIDAALSWPSLVDALDAGHRLGRGQTHDLLLEEGGDILLSRTAWKAGYGIGVKTVTGFFGNPGRRPPLPSVQGVFVLFDHEDGRPLAVIDGAGITGWKTAADSALGSRYLSRPDARCLLMVGAGAMAKPLIRAHLCVRPDVEKVLVWNRTPARAEVLAAELRADGRAAAAVADLAAAVAHADIVSCATRSETPLIQGAWLRPGAHLDLVGAFTATMREADDAALRRGRLFVDARETTLEHIGELAIPIARGVIRRDDIVADLYDLAAGFAWQRGPDDITIYKNGGGAHLDLMTAVAIHRGAQARS
ncbi:MAG TPA: ornithine cyclodeaminase [Geminicoccaceae bacterium]|nr:ornithine cyclodeaminase [Geminicoccaceae bacterium]